MSRAGDRAPEPPLVRVDSLAPGQVVRPYPGFAPWRVVHAAPIPDDPAEFWRVTLRAVDDGREGELELPPGVEVNGDWEKPSWWPEGVV